ncbi:hypothetical protein R3W88_033058 [Solanum pinnatisectum]|uniref:Reverse transcriptase zinc-binding domain-containing protein n=1 Tax=Solanum pinnatisectum TaxID=50273 RepID=A0AAV9K210_9SOLN|nr:hypothetical protein R3W88_033058 [Solanum pinnatisectum]
MLIPHILSTSFQYQQGVKDTAVWKPTEAGIFSCASALEICRHRQNTGVISNQIWHKQIPFKISFLVWRALRCKLLTNETLANFGVEPARCFYCIKQGWDDVDHIFNEGPFATHIWTYFSSTMEANSQQTSLSNRLLNWWEIQGENEAHKTLVQTVPIVVCWNLWKNRCLAKYGAKKSSSSRVKYIIFKDILYILNSKFPYIQWPVKWPEVVDMAE